jgi:hypothetical protein
VSDGQILEFCNLSSEGKSNLNRDDSRPRASDMLFERHKAAYLLFELPFLMQISQDSRER